MYLDSVSEQVALIEKGASRPPKYVTHTPVLFDAWMQWYDMLPHPTHEGTMKEMGEKNAPDFVKYEFKGLEEFYNHYNEMITEVE